MKITLPWRTTRRDDLAESIPKAYKPWILLSMAALIGGLFLLAIAVVAAFVFFARQGTPLWVIVLGVFAVLGILAGFGGLFLMLAAAAWSSFRADRHVQVLPPADPPL